MRHHACATGGGSSTARITAATLAGFALIAATSVYGQTLTQGPLSPGAVVSDASFGTSAWTLPNNASASDNTYTVSAPGGIPTQYLKATNFGFNIPGPAQIFGIEVSVERRSTVGLVTDERARIVKGGVIGAAERALPGAWPTVDTPVTYGTPSDLWGETWTPADVNAAGFGFALSVDDGVDTAAVDHITITVTYSLCASAPAGSCRTAAKSILVIKDNANNAKDKIVWKWVKGASTTQAEFGDPVMGTANMALCIYETGGLVGEALVAPGPGWSVVSTKGWKFLNKAGTQDGIQKIILKGSTNNKAKALVKGKGLNLPDPSPPLTLPVTVQLVNSQTGICWEGVFATATKNVAGSFKAKDQ